DLLSALGCPQERAEGREADEVLAAYAHLLEGREEVVIRSDDKDFMQLLGPATRMEGRRRGTVEAGDVEEILGVPPELVADLLALAGDEADGIPGILPPGAARELLSEAGPVGQWIEGGLPEGVDPEVRRTVEGNREQLRLNLRLVDLSEGAAGEPEPPDWRGWADPDAARAIGREAGIGYLTEEDPAEAFGELLRRGRRTRERLEELGAGQGGPSR
ncbi:MAG: hypothetical protein ABEJ46_02580, partial [Gemmatimonadota bacterium]